MYALCLGSDARGIVDGGTTALDVLNADSTSFVPTGRLAAKIARKESLSLKLALRPDRQELINRNILQLQTDNERQETKEAIGAKLIRCVHRGIHVLAR